ncbi:hypothetical protein ACFFJB_13745 [Camelimonas abortus]|uniref:Zinc-or iron-chelating protein n=1 Tax=Camelimonas abortus TaxID=1017184 RepID=A0ABV7LBZ7_9HYPH
MTGVAGQGAGGRTCGSCTLCCKVMGIAALAKPRGRWCPRCRPGKGCASYATRPQECRSFACLWLGGGFLGDEWRPDRCKMVLYTEHGGARLVVQTDPGAGPVWRREPWLGQIRAWAAAAAASRRQVMVMTGDVATLVLPDRDVHLGRLREGDQVIVHERLQGGAPAWEVEVRPAAG